jgi:hypothetical protein
MLSSSWVQMWPPPLRGSMLRPLFQLPMWVWPFVVSLPTIESEHKSGFCLMDVPHTMFDQVWIINNDNDNYINDFYFIFIFSNLWCFSRSSRGRFNHVLAIDHVYGEINLLKYFCILDTSPRTHGTIIS